MQQNGCGGDATKFEVAFEGDGTSRRFQLHFVDALSGTPFAAIPVLIMAPASGGAHHVILEAGQHVDGLHFGNRYVGPERGSITGTKWLDANGNAEKDPREPGIAGVTIYLDLNFNNEWDPHEPTTTTAADNPLTDRDEAGFYRFGNVDPGRYAVREVVPEGSIQTYPQLIVIDPLPPLDSLPDGASHFIAVRPGETVTGIDFGNQPVKPATIHGQKWLDRNGNGVREDNEPGLAGVTIYVDRNYNGRWDDGEPFAVSQADNPITRIDETGWYSIANLRPGYAAIREIVPDGFQQTFPRNLVAPDRRDVQHFVYLTSGEELRNLDFGNQPLGSAAVTGIKWFDRNSNGQQEPNEPGLAGVVIYSDLNFNGQWDRTEPYTITAEDNPDTLPDETGRYRLTGLTPGEHLIREILPDGYIQTFPLPPDLTSTDPTNYPYYFQLEANDVKTNVDFGNRPKQMTGDFDEDGDIDATDIDILAAAIRDFDIDPKFDLNLDDRLDLRDFVFMIKRVLLTDFGDANLDGRFDSKDLIAVFQAGEYEDGIDGNSGWAEGDWSGDGDFDTQDLV
ncbi:MAG: hypothetical protein KDA87_24615, partial [Planctomycetales bacterium]|nr:hypothetical protein [Planctomycetales bacterium]